MLKWLNDNSKAVTALLALAAVLVILGAYKMTVDDLKQRVEKLEAQPRAIVQAPDPRAIECARIARQIYADGSIPALTDQADRLLLRLGCDQPSAARTR
ncbi:MAG: hypothetical protein JOZ90_09180 [Alphaproteobacteria bacterium]|nr:hypothetical protein [Alphaproteobacteria bacterium]MBV9373293.1 hypothetical protein [Alphaproteobacteria bacterium]MBV9901256.1 hypothetical protein [Alphaproteobacteria bacterium]